jgi:hypothetical protein
MRTLLMKKAASYLATASLVACPFVSSVTAAMPSQLAFMTTSSSAIRADKPVGNPVLVRSASDKPDAPTTTSSAKVQDKKAISRCWKRLMNMAREVTHAHHTKK